MSVSEALMSAKTFAGFPNDRRIAIPTSDATRTKILALRSSNEPRSSCDQSRLLSALAEPPLAVLADHTVISRSKSGEILISLGPRGNPFDDAAAADAALICRSRIWSAPGPHRRNPALVQMSAVKGRPEMAKRRDWRAGF